MKVLTKWQQYRNGSWIAVFSIILLSGIFFAVSNFSKIPEKQVLAEAYQYSSEISDALYEMEIQLNQYGEIINELLDKDAFDGNELPDNEKKLDSLSKQLNIILKQFTQERNIVTGYFFNLNAVNPSAEYELYYNQETSKTSHISTLMNTVNVKNMNEEILLKEEPLWKTNYNPFSDIVHLQYVIPLYEQDNYIGFMGITVNTDYLNNVITDNQEGTEFGLLTDTNEILIHSRYKPGEALRNIYDGKLIDFFRVDREQNSMKMRNSQGKFIIYAYTTLPSGQIFLEVQELSTKMARTNYLTFCVACISILIILIVRKNKTTGQSTFDNLAKRLIAMKGNRRLSEGQENRMKAIIALEFGICMMLTTYALYQAFFIHNIIGFAIFILWVFYIHCFLYRYIKGKINENQKFLFVCSLFLIMVGFHVLNGGFGEKETGAAISWMLGILVFGCFLLSPKRTNQIFSMFVIFLFIDVMVELYFLQNIYYERMFVFVTSLFYAGFSLYTAISIYLKESISEGKKIIRLLNEVKETQSYLIQQEKMVALGQLISGVSHEINTPIGAIKGAAQTMKSGLEPMIKLLQRCKEEFEDVDYECFFGLIDLASDGIKQMKNTIEIRQAKKEIEVYLEEIDLPDREEILEFLIRLEITDLTKLKESSHIVKNTDLCEILRIVGSLSGFIVGIQTILFATTRVTRILFALKSYAYTGSIDETIEMDIIKNIENILVLYHNQLKQNIEVIKEYDNDIPNIVGKPDELAQVWTNLVQNAVYAMKEGGTLTITVRVQEKHWIEISMKDTGTGIAESVVERIYDPFFTTKPLGEGSGLGLDISRKVVLAHGGTIHVESELIKGTKFVIRLPICAP